MTLKTSGVLEPGVTFSRLMARVSKKGLDTELRASVGDPDLDQTI